MKIQDTMSLLAVISMLLFSSLSWADGGGLSLGVIRAGQLSFFQTDGNCFTGIVDWMPAFHLGSTFALRAMAGGTLIKTKSEETKPYIEVGGLLSMALGTDFSLEGGVGLANFVQNGGARLMVPVNAVSRVNWGMIGHLALGYAAVLIPTNLTHEIRLGVGTSF